MKVMFVISSLSKGGAERVVSNLSNYLINENEISIITVQKCNPSYNLDNRILVQYLDDSIKGNILLKVIRRIIRLSRYKKSIKPDIVIAFLPNPCYYAIMSNFFYKTKTIISIRNDPKIEYNTLFKKVLSKILYSKVDGIIFQTEEAKNFFPKNIKDKSIIIPNPINQDFINDRYTGKREKIIVGVGRLAEQKNFNLLIEAFSVVAKKYSDYKLVIYGEGDLRESLEELITKKNMSDKVYLPGNIENIKDKIKSASLFVMPSLYEGMPNALMEAMALGLPCISTDCPCGGPRFLIKNNINGILIKNNDKGELICAIEKILNDRLFANKISEESYKICEELNPQKINAIWKKYIEKIKIGEKNE